VPAESDGNQSVSSKVDEKSDFFNELCEITVVIPESRVILGRS
jgi:hypothetical protein